MTTPNGWPASSRSIRPGTPPDRARPVPDRRRVEPEGLAERDGRERVVDVEPAGQPELERPGAGRRDDLDPEAVRRLPRRELARTSAAGSVP